MAKRKIKRRLAAHEEFEIMKLVLDKFLWIATGLLGWGIYRSISYDVQDGGWYILAGIILFICFKWFLATEFEHIR